jgi:rRNA maturation endonuclease Nob1
MTLKEFKIQEALGLTARCTGCRKPYFIKDLRKGTLCRKCMWKMLFRRSSYSYE